MCYKGQVRAQMSAPCVDETTPAYPIACLSRKRPKLHLPPYSLDFPLSRFFFFSMYEGRHDLESQRTE